MIIILLIVLLVVILTSIRIVQQEHIAIVERLGQYHGSWGAGIHFLIPGFDKIRKDISLKEQTYDFPESTMITKDNIVVKVDSVVYMKVMDPKKYYYGIEDPVFGVSNLTTTTLRSIVGSKTFDELLNSRDAVNSKMTEEIDSATDEWGIKVRSVELKKIEASKEVRETMQKDMTAERQKRATILEAQAHQQSVVTAAEGEKKAKILAAEAEKEARIALAEGEAEALRLVYEAQAQGLKLISDINVTPQVLALKKYEALADIADGNATKIYMPADLSSEVTKAGIFGEALGIGDAIPVTKKSKEETSNANVLADHIGTGEDHCQNVSDSHKSDVNQIKTEAARQREVLPDTISTDIYE